MTKSQSEREELASLGQACLDHLAGDPEQLLHFMQFAGYDPAGLRRALGSDELHLGLLEYFIRNEPVLLAMSENTGIPVGRIERFWQRRNPEG